MGHHLVKQVTKSHPEEIQAIVVDYEGLYSEPGQLVRRVEDSRPHLPLELRRMRD